MKRVVVAYEKHGIRIFDISTDELSNKSYLKLFNERKEAGYYSDELFNSTKFKEASSGNGKSAMVIIKSRKSYEYEMIEELKIQ